MIIYLIYLLSVKLNIDKNKKINWKKVIYPPNLVKPEDKKATKDKKRQNFRIKCVNYTLDKKNDLYFKKIVNKEKKLLKIPLDYEMINLFKKSHDEMK